MSSIANNEFQIADLIAVKYKEEFIEYMDSNVKKQLEGVFFNHDTIYFLEKITSHDNGVYREYYEDVLYAIDLFEREAKEPFQYDPDFLEIIPFPIDYLTEEELTKKTITRWRLFTIFQLVNSDFQPKKNNDNIKKIGQKVRN